MPLVVLDPIVLVNTAKAPEGMSAKLLTVLAYGRVCAYLQRGLAAEEAELRDTAVLGKGWDANVVRARRNAHVARAELERAIPLNGSGCRPDDWRMAVSYELCGKALRRVGRLREEHNLNIDAGTVWASFVMHASQVLAETWGAVPDYTGFGDYDLDGNVSIHTALRMGAEMLIT